MSRPVAIVIAGALALAAVEGVAYWWMHPAPAGLTQPVLCYRPETSRSAGVTPASEPPSPNPESAKSATTSSYTSLPELVASALPSLRCTTGTAARIDRADGATVHLAFFEWDLTDSTSVLEAFKHLPEQCLGSIGMTFIEHRPARLHQVAGETLAFDHTVFRDPGGTIVHAFKGTWVSGGSSLLDPNFRGGLDQWRQLRWQAAIKRFHPAHARVAQGAVRGIPSPDLAWQAFQETMLKDLRFEAIAER